ncbi:MAG: hypothetical protein WC980_10735 [Candidatus Brocadiia bacterium]
MPTKKVKKKKGREYREKLLDDAGVTDKEIALSIKKALSSDNPAERSKALDIAERWKFDEVKNNDDKLEILPLANIKLEDMVRLANKCHYCKHKKFEPLRGGNTAAPAAPGTEPTGKTDSEPAGCPELPIDTEEPLKSTEGLNEPNPQEKAG